MKLDKKTIVFGSVFLVILLFTLSYTLLVWKKEDTNVKQLPTNPNIPSLQVEDNSFRNRREAVDQLKEKKPSVLPSLYDEIEQSEDSILNTDVENSSISDRMGLEDNTGQKSWTMDSWSFQNDHNSDSIMNISRERDGDQIQESTSIHNNDHLNDALNDTLDDPLRNASFTPEEVRLRQESFFSYTDVNTDTQYSRTNDSIPVAVFGTQKVEANSRLELYLLKDSYIQGKYYPAFSPVYGFVSFGPNRVFLKITNIQGDPISLSAYDLQDGNEGIYVVNNFRAEASREVLDDVIQDINIPSVPQVGGLKNLFRRHNRNIKVHILDQYRLFLKPEPLN